MIASLIYWVVVVGLIVWGVWMAILSAYWASQKQNGNIFFIAIRCLGRPLSMVGLQQSRLAVLLVIQHR